MGISAKYLALILFGPIAGFIDSIAGGGGLITLPVLTMAVGPGAHAIGTNKIVGSMGALMALLVYLRKGHMSWVRSIAFTVWVVCGSFAGSHVTPMVPISLFRWFLFATCPLILWIVWRKDLWVKHELEHQAHIRHAPASLFEPRVAAAGLLCGFYDGMWGPGGGTFMLLGLLFVARLPLLTALAASKFANTGSALMALASFSAGGYVHWKEGAIMATGMSLGALVGAHFATRRASSAVRPILAIVAALLVLKIILT